ncbi:ABC transporter substrate-binding protein [Saccharomonospora sp. NPDC046836]|uniref:ABC transporter substrate-binding protein n=1 Tax=Saccharomonospora sp. NPDC046836 TaxID=3156921 RepID=UPI0033DD7235
MNARISRLTGGIAALAVSALALSACAGSSTSGDGTDGEPFIYNVGSPNPTVAMAPYNAVPTEMGYWADQGLDVETVYVDGNALGLQALIGGRADIAVSSTDAVYAFAAQAPNLRIVALTPKNLWRIAVPESSPVQSVEDLKGKTVGAISLTGGSYSYGRSIVQSAGLDPEADVQWLPVSYGTQAAEALNEGRVAAYSSYDGPIDIVSQLTDEPLRPLPSPLDDVAGSMAYVVTAETLEERPEAIEKFLRGTYQGMQFAQTNPAAAIEIYWGQHPDQTPTTGTHEEALASTIEATANSWAARAVPGDDGIWGYLTPERVAQAATFFEQHGVIEGTADTDTVVDLSVTQRASDFDVAAIDEQASKWTAE